jgi:hypothetical protein
VGDGDPALTARRRAERRRGLPALTGVLAGLLLLVALQFLLLMVAVESWLGGKGSILGAVATASGVCLAGAAWLLKTAGSSRSG